MDILNLWYIELGNTTTGTGCNCLTDKGPFDVNGGYFWTQTYDAGTGSAWQFGFHDGYQDVMRLDHPVRYTWAVRDITSSNPVAPEPISSTLFIVGGATLGFRLFRKRKHT